MPSDPTRSTTLVVLAGGAGVRMGVPKSHVRIDGRPILEQLHRYFAWPGPTLLVTAPGLENPPGAKCFEREVKDEVAGEGPLRGILTALRASDTERTVIATVDMPCVARPHLRWLAESLAAQPQAHGVFIRRNARVEPFPCAVRTTAAEGMAARLALQRRSVNALADLPHFLLLDAPREWPDATWTNLNTPDDLQAWEHGEKAGSTNRT